MRKSLLMAGVALFGIFSQAMAYPVAAGSTIDISGTGVSFNGSDFAFSNLASITGVSGSYIAIETCANCVTMNSPLVYEPFTPEQIFAASNNGVFTQFYITSVITANDTGMVQSGEVTGYTTLGASTDTVETASLMTYSIDDCTGDFMATVTSTAVTEPASIAVFGIGLLGLGFVMNRRREISVAT